MAPRRRKTSGSEAEHVRAVVRNAQRLESERARVQRLARESLIHHFQQAADIFPVAEDQERRARMAKKLR